MSLTHFNDSRIELSTDRRVCEFNLIVVVMSCRQLRPRLLRFVDIIGVNWFHTKSSGEIFISIHISSCGKWMALTVTVSIVGSNRNTWVSRTTTTTSAIVLRLLSDCWCWCWWISVDESWWCCCYNKLRRNSTDDVPTTHNVVALIFPF